MHTETVHSKRDISRINHYRISIRYLHTFLVSICWHCWWTEWCYTRVILEREALNRLTFISDLTLKSLIHLSLIVLELCDRVVWEPYIGGNVRWNSNKEWFDYHQSKRISYLFYQMNYFDVSFGFFLSFWMILLDPNHIVCFWITERLKLIRLEYDRHLALFLVRKERPINMFVCLKLVSP